MASRRQDLSQTIRPAVYKVWEIAALLARSDWSVYQELKEKRSEIPGVLHYGEKNIRFKKRTINEWLGIASSKES